MSTTEAPSLLSPLNVDLPAKRYRDAKPVHFFCIENFLERSFAEEVSAVCPDYHEAVALGGRQFNALNEDVKVQLTDVSHFPDSIRRLSDLLANPTLVDRLSRITGIPELVADPVLSGGGMHVMGPGGKLGVHVDFNYQRSTGLHRRLNLILYLNRRWDPAWGGELELWDPEMKRRLELFQPTFNRAVLFNTTRVSFHGVNAIRCPSGVTRNSFAVFYYTRQAPPEWPGKHQTTIYRAPQGALEAIR
ncbi:MAG TPA: 2OG-Fe(II) oxygenase, partial [Actinobacteria bacterium]|nr:2OG-Fe(II) oxygenase [Actinomycetota bacterium]